MTSSPLRLAIAVAFLALASVQAATVGAQPPVYLTQWGSYGSGDGQFNDPVGVATDSAGNVYVLEQLGHRIQKFTDTGTYLTQWGSFGSANGQFGQPLGIATDAAGNVYVADNSNHRIQKFSGTGNYLTQWGSQGSGSGQFNNPAGVATDAAGDVYVADQGNHRIQKFTSTGTYLTHWGSQGSGNGQFDYPRGVATDTAGNLYVTEYRNHRIQKFTGTGAYLTQWGSFGVGDGEFRYPWGVATDAAGNVYVVDTSNYRIQEFTDTGTYLTQWGTPFGGGGNGQFANAIGVATDAAGNVYVADTGNNRIQKFGPGPPGPATCDLILTQSDSMDPVTVGQTFSYNLLLRNAGPWDAEDVFVRNPIPAMAALQYVYSNRGSCYDSSGTVVCNLGSVPPSDSAGAFISITLYAHTPGTIENVANAVTSTFDVNAANNAAVETTTVQQAQVADVFVGQSHAPDPAVAGGSVTFTVIVGNRGPSAATDAQMFFSTYGSADSIASVSTNRGSCADTVGCCVTCQLGTLATGDSARIEVRLIPLQEGGITSYAYAGSAVQDPDFFNNSSYDFVPILFSAEQRINGLIALIGSMSLKSGNQKTLMGPLQDALAALAAEDTSRACADLDAFRRRLGKLVGKGLTLTEAFALDYEADQIQTRLGCSNQPGAAMAGRLGQEVLSFSFRLRSSVGSAAQADLALPAAGRVRLDVYDVGGRLVRTAHDGELSAGAHVVDWDGRGSEGGRAPSGVYFLRVAAGGDGAVARFVLLR